MTDDLYRTSGSMDDRTDISDDVRGLQIVTAGLLMGITFFSAVALVTQGVSFDTPPDIMFWVGLVFAAGCFVMHLIVPAVVRRRQLSQLNSDGTHDSDRIPQPHQLTGVYRGTHLIACALLEGAAFFNLVGYLIDGFVGSLGVAVFLALCIAARFPTTPRVHSWIKTAAEDMAVR